MGKKGSSKKTPTATSGTQTSITIREASTGKKHTNAKSLLKLQHIKNLAVWASGDAAIPSLGAFFGHHFAASSEALRTPVEPSLFTCQRCESILQPGYNCTIRIEKSKKNVRCKGKKGTVLPQNNIVYTCHFCSHQNMKRGTLRNTSAPKAKQHPMPRPMQSRVHEPASSTDKETDITKDNVVANTITTLLGSTAILKGKMGIVEMSETWKVKDESAASGLATPLTKITLTLLESKMKKRNRSGAKKTVTSESTYEAQKMEKSVNTSNRRRRKSWTSLKEIAESCDSGTSRRLMNLTVPLSMQ